MKYTIVEGIRFTIEKNNVVKIEDIYTSKNHKILITKDALKRVVNSID